MDSTDVSPIPCGGESNINIRTPDLHVLQDNSRGITGYGVKNVIV